MAAYICEICGMSVRGMTCGKCGKQLVHDTITQDDGKPSMCRSVRMVMAW